MNKCSGCNRDFTSLTAFDRHRTGSFSRNERRCMSEQGMSAARLERKASGKWGLIATAQFRARIERLKDQTLKTAV